MTHRFFHLAEIKVHVDRLVSNAVADGVNQAVTELTRRSPPSMESTSGGTSGGASGGASTGNSPRGLNLVGGRGVHVTRATSIPRGTVMRVRHEDGEDSFQPSSWN